MVFRISKIHTNADFTFSNNILSFSFVKDLKGTKHSGIMQNNKGLEMNLQFFAENDVPKQSSASLKRAIRN